MNEKIDETLNGLSNEQFGAFARTQAYAKGVRSDAIDRRVARGIFRDETPRVVVSNSAPDSFEQRATIARLDAGPDAVISILTTLAWVGVPGFTLEPIHISRRRKDTRKPGEGIVWHYPRLMLPSHVYMLNGLATTTATRALADMLALPGFNPKRAERALDSARSARFTNHVLLSRMADEWCGRGRRGSVALRDYLARKPADWVPAASNVARRFIELVVSAGMPEPRSEVNVGDEVAWLGRVDCVDPELPLIAEIDSDRYHTSPLDVQADEEREKAITRAGFEVIRFTEHEVWHKPGWVMAQWRAKRAEVRGKLAG